MTSILATNVTCLNYVQPTGNKQAVILSLTEPDYFTHGRTRLRKMVASVAKIVNIFKTEMRYPNHKLCLCPLVLVSSRSPPA